ncbi:G-protein coupled receptor Mth2 [Trachymyrmex zeteki]|uniref:G-protein coupled receptor Mth2 n=1 Tax=Mycetomoellerius zeteki TaxID=64791 RepID=A0A151X3L6_9HYME|nr:G-protein coupled receptor Mth2 [Trachymyrmex zeteki]
MCPPSIVLCFAFLFVTSFSESQDDFTNGNEQSDNLTVQSDPLVNSIKYRNEEMKLTRSSQKNSIKNNDEMQYESCINSTKNNCKNDSVGYESRENIIKNHKDNNQTSMEFCTNSTDINDFTLQEINKNLTKTEDKNNSISYKLDSNRIIKTTFQYEACNDDITCIQFCCPFGNILMTTKGRCISPLPNKHGNDSQDKTVDELFLTIHDPCVSKGYDRKFLFPNTYLFLTNGYLYNNHDGELILPESYCFAILFRDNRNIYDVIVCDNQTTLPIFVSICLLLSLPFLLLTFIIYSILPEFQNIHGYTLRAHVGSLFITYAIMCFGQVSGLDELTLYCVPLAYIFNFFFLSSFFWLNVICFDIWWTFREFRPYRRGAKKRKKLIIYSIYAWGVTIILNVICFLMDNLPIIPINVVRPEICQKRFWFSENEAKTLYFYVPMGATIISNIFFFICTTLTILYQKIYIAQLEDSEIWRHDENKQRFNMYLKLFVVMGITWVLEIMSWIDIGANIVSQFIWYPADIINALQGLTIFIIFVCRKKTLLTLLNRFDWKICDPFKIPISDSRKEFGTIHMQRMGSSN